MGSEAVRRDYDRLSAVYDSHRVSGYFTSTLRRLTALLGEPAGPVLEIGCGTGGYLVALRAAGYEAYGVDYSERMCEVARGKLTGLAERPEEIVRCADVEESLGFDRRFAAIYVMDAWECFPAPARVVANAERALEQDGRFLIFTPNAFWRPLIVLLETLRIKKLRPAFVYGNSSRRRTLRAVGPAFRLERHIRSYFTLESIFVFRRRGGEARAGR